MNSETNIFEKVLNFLQKIQNVPVLKSALIN